MKEEVEKGKQKEENNYVRWFSELSKDDVELVGGKGANLSEMTKIGIPVPPGFVITSKAYSYFLEKTGLDKKIYEKLKELKEEETDKLTEISKEIREMIEKEELPSDLQELILEDYENLNVPIGKEVSGQALEILKKTREDVFVAIRSSATAEDSSTASFAGQQDTFLNIKGKTNLIEHIKKCFSSLFTPRSIYYRIKKGFEHEKVLNAVVVQKMVQSDKSGVMFTINPVNQEDELVIEAVFGLGEGIVSGRISPDNYVVSKDLEIKDKKIVNKKIAIVRNSSGENEIVKLTDERSKQQVLDNFQIRKFSEYGLKIEKHYKKPQDIEFAVEGEELYIVQTRPITTLEKKQGKEVQGEVLVKGLAASPGIDTGKVKIIEDLKELGKIQKGDILVTKMTNPDMVVAMQKAAGIVTDEGGLTSHAAIVSREMGIPAVVGTDNATTKLQEGQIVSVDGFTGRVIKGEVEEKLAEIEKVVDTKLKLKLIVDLPDYAERASKTGIKEIGLTRLEGIIAKMEKHPLWYYKNNQLDRYSELIFDGLKKISKYFNRIWVRASDLRTDEFSRLEGSPEKEGNPMLGNHGARFLLKYPEILKAELKAISKIEKEIGIMFPQVMSINEVEKLREIFDEICKDENKKFGVMIETPASVQIIDDICKKVDFVSIGSNDLTQYTLAIDRNDEDVQELYDEMHPAVLSQIKKVLRVCKENNTESSLCGQAGSKKKMAEFLLKNGISSISVNADKAKEISELIKELEEQGIESDKQEETEQKNEQDNIEKEEKVDDVVKELEEKVEEEKQEVKGKIEEEKQEFPDTEIEVDVFSNLSGKIQEAGKTAENLQKEIEKQEKQEEKEENGRNVEEVLEETAEDLVEEELDIF